MRDNRRMTLTWLGAVSVITLALVPIRLYLLSANDWLIGALSTLGLFFLIAYFLAGWLWNAKPVETPRA